VCKNHSVTSNLSDLSKDKRDSKKYDDVLSKLFMMTPQRAFCVHLMRQYTVKGKDKTSINIMHLTMIDPAKSWFDTI
jgi:hypothetical protein